MPSSATADCNGRRLGVEPADGKKKGRLRQFGQDPVTRATAVSRLWKRPAVRSTVYQAAALGIITIALALAWSNIAANLPRMRLELGLGFLGEVAAFELGDNLVGYSAGHSYFWAFIAGITNTLKVAVLGIVLTTVLGTVIALARLSRNVLVSNLAWLYVEVMRNIPLLLQILFWHTFIVRQLPNPRQAWNPLPGVFFSNRGMEVPSLGAGAGLEWMLVALSASAVVLFAAILRSRRHREKTGHVGLFSVIASAVALALPTAVFFAVGTPFSMELPELRGFNFQGGSTLTPEFVALLFALVTYQAGFAAETIRSGILGVTKGQVEAALSLGLSRGKTLRLVVLPQALRIVVPPLTSQYLSLTKNSSLAVAVGYPDLVRVSTVVIGETGRSIECIAIILAVYLTLSLLTAAAMNLYNRRIALKGR